MAKYFFHVDLCGIETRDAVGAHLVDLASALQHAMRLAWRVMAEEVSQGRLCLACSIIIEHDETGERTIVPFRDTLKLSGIGPR